MATSLRALSSLIVLTCALQISSMAKVHAGLEIDIQPKGHTEEELTRLTHQVLARPEIQSMLVGTKYRILSAAFIEDELPQKTPFGASNNPQDGRNFQLQIYDYTNGRLLTISGENNFNSPSHISETFSQPVPIHDEFEEAIRILNGDPAFSSNSPSWKPYTAMPPTIAPEETGAAHSDRIIPVGIEPDSQLRKHEIVGVNLSRGTVHRFSSGAPKTAEATERVCGAPPARQGVTRKGLPGRADITVRKGGETIWSMEVIRPSDSSGSMGSGVEIRDVTYRGKKVLAQAHMPILNVQYERDACGPYRDWSYAENAFVANGTTITQGILRASERPSTVHDTGNDRGNFYGVAVFEEDSELVLISELSAGWYRYVSEFRFSEDGTIQPLFRFSSVQNSCVCNKHVHHAYWRFDFDMDGRDNNQIQVLGTSGWQTLSRETKQNRGPTSREWRIVNKGTGFGYQITPRSQDGRADAYGQGDVWALRYKRGEIDDSSVRRSTIANLDAFVSGDSLDGEDIVLWYAGHVTHIDDDTSLTSWAGPILRPLSESADD